VKKNPGHEKYQKSLLVMHIKGYGKVHVKDQLVLHPNPFVMAVGRVYLPALSSLPCAVWSCTSITVCFKTM